MISKNQITDEYFELINIIRHTDASDIKGLALEANMSWPTVNQKIKYLNDENYIIANAQNDKRFLLNPTIGYFLGISIGVLDTKICLLDYTFRHVKLLSETSNNIDSFISQISNELGLLGIQLITTSSGEYIKLTRCIDYSHIYRVCTVIVNSAIEFLDNNDYKILSVGLSLPGIVDIDSGSLEFSPNFPSLVGLKVSNIIGNSTQEKLIDRDILFHVYHDTLAATVYEKEHLYLVNNINKRKKNIAVMYLEYGFGCSYILQNRLITSAAGEFGHIQVSFNEDDIDESGKRGLIAESSSTYHIASSDTPELNINIDDLPPCSCGNTHCLERLIRVHTFNSNDVEDYIKKTTNLSHFSEEHPYRYSKFKYLLSRVINTTVNLVTPDLIILSGELINSMQKLKDDLEFNMYNSALKPSSKHCSIINGTHKHDGTAAGAAILSYYHKYSQNDELNISWI